MNRRKIIWISLAVLLGLVLLSVAVWGSRGLKVYVQQKGEAVLKAPWSFQRMEVNLVQRKVILHDVKVSHPERKGESLAEVRQMVIRLESLISLISKDKPIAIKLKNPKIIFSTSPNGEWELAGRIPLIRRVEGERRLAPFNIESLSVEDGLIEFRDGRVGPVIPLSKVSFKAEHWRLPTKEDPLPVRFEGSFLIRNSAEGKIQGEGDFLSPQTSLLADLKIRNLPLPPFAPYYEGPLPARIISGAASFTTKARVENDHLKVPVHAEVSGLKVELKKNKSFGFAADMVVDSMRNSRGNVELDLLIAGDLRRPQFLVLTDLDSPISSVLKQTGKEIKEGFKSGWRKFKSIF